MRTVLMVAFISFCFSACDKSPSESSFSSVTPRATTPAETILIQTGSPDQAVKSWWRFLDFVETGTFESCKKYPQLPFPDYQKLLYQVAMEDVLKDRKDYYTGCIHEEFSREINEVKMESETRAIVFATIKNTTPLPEGAEPDKLELEQRAQGFKFKYLVEKDGGDWKIAQVYEYRKAGEYIKGDPWEKVYTPSDKPFVHSYVFRQ